MGMTRPSHRVVEKGKERTVGEIATKLTRVAANAGAAAGWKLVVRLSEPSALAGRESSQVRHRKSVTCGLPIAV